jgi:AsmA protein
LTINLVRFPDGTTNLERLQARLSPPSAGRPGPSQKPGDLSSLQVGHFSLHEGSIHFIAQLQEKGGRYPELNIQHLHIDLHDLRAGKPLDVLVQAAVLTNQQNFELRLVSAPLPASLIPTPKELSLKIQPTDLRPIAPYIPKSVGLQDGRFAADLTANLGAVVPGGEGETRIRGTLDALGLRFVSAEGSKPFDIVLDAALQADVHRGDVQIDRLRLDLGPAEITGKGRAFGLTGDKPRIEGLEVVTRNFDPAQIAALFPPLREQLKGQVAGPIGILLRGSGNEGVQTIELKVDLTPVRLAIPEMLAKAAGAPLTATAHLGGAPAGTTRFDFQADLTGVDLRPGRFLNKAPGQQLDLALSGTKSANPADRLKVTLEKITVHLEDAVFTGSASAEFSDADKSKRTDFEASVHSPHLDLDKLLAFSQRKQKSSAMDPATFAGLRGHVVAKIDDLRKSNIDFKNVVADAKLIEDQLTLQVLSFDAFGGKVSANGTTVRLGGPKSQFQLAARAQNIEMAQALTWATDRKVISGAFGGDLDFSGAGLDQEDLTHSLSGSLQGHLVEGKFLANDLIASVSGPLARALPRGLASGKSEDGSLRMEPPV